MVRAPQSAHRAREVGGTPLTSVANHTKLEELRQAMLRMEKMPTFVWEDVNGHIARPDREWFHHFLGVGYETMRTVEIIPDEVVQFEEVGRILAKIGLAGTRTERGFKIYGYTLPGEQISRFQ